MINHKKLVSVLVVLFFSVVLSVHVLAEQAASSASAPSSSASAKLININTASSDQLVKLPRIGEVIAQRIIDFRQKNGKFAKPADLMKVKGIGEKTFEKLKNLITV